MILEARNQVQSFLAPRPYFKRRLVGAVKAAGIQWSTQRVLPKPAAVAQARGVRFEKKVCDFLAQAYPKHFVPNLLVKFQDSRVYRTQEAVLDGLLFDADFRACAIIEVKFRHTIDAWHQLFEFYLPIVQKALPGIRVIPLEVCKFYDPTVKVEQIRVRESNEDLGLLFAPWNAGSYNVWQWGVKEKWETSAGSPRSYSCSSGKLAF